MSLFHRPGFARFQEKVNSAGNDLYLKGDDFAGGRKGRLIAWVFETGLVDLFSYQEGWISEEVEVNKKKEMVDKPVRFEADLDKFPALPWKMSSFKGGPLRPQKPKAALSFLWVDEETNSIKCCTLTTASALKQLLGYVNPQDDQGRPNKQFIEDLRKVDLFIKKIDDRNWQVNVINDRNTPEELTEEQLKLVAEFKWSWEDFLECKSPTDNGYDWKAVVKRTAELESGQAPAIPAERPKPEAKRPEGTGSAPAAKVPAKSNWRERQLAGGKKLGEMSLEALTKYLGQFEDWAKTKSPQSIGSATHLDIKAGIAELTPANTSDMGEMPEVEWGDDEPPPL